MTILKFNGQWRTYQKNILDNLNTHLKDKKLHIVAAPGAGKTTLGIEVIARINKPVLIFAPTLTIRNQWKDRIISAFLQDKNEDIVSTDIFKPKQITVITYQSLWSAFVNKNPLPEDEIDDTVTDKEDENEEESKSKPKTAKKVILTRKNKVISLLKKQGVKLLCFDEAHHLRNEWWKALDTLISELKPEQTLALTATPPYDVTFQEWKRYEKICGPIDDCIPIPELVKNGDLCPHQDYVYFSELQDDEKEVIDNLEIKTEAFMDYLMAHKAFGEALIQSPYLSLPKDNIEFIYEQPDFFIAASSYLHACGLTVPSCFLNLFDMSSKEIPPFDEIQAEIFLNGILFDYNKQFAFLKSFTTEIEKKATQTGIVNYGRLYLTTHPQIRKQISASKAKIQSIMTIIGSEYDVLKDGLRLVVLTDYIRENAQQSHTNTLGVVPIFLRATELYSHIPMAILTGTLVVISASQKDKLLELAEKENLCSDDFKFTNFKEKNCYLKVTFAERCRNKVVKLMTEMFNLGYFNILVGTQALLGEGWDAPSINSLILSSTIASYMSSNQMRGRAIRVDKNNPTKTANIWHLVTLKKLNLWNIAKYQSVDSRHIFDNYGFDLAQLKRRFMGFEAPQMQSPHNIQSGWERLGISHVHQGNIAEINKQTLLASRNRAGIYLIWKKALYEKTGSRMYLGFNTAKKQKSFCFKGTFTWLFFLYAGIAFELYSVLQRFDPSSAIPMTAVFVAWFIGRLLYRLFLTGSISGSLQQVTTVVLKTLIYMREITTPIRNTKIIIQKAEKGTHFCTVKGLSSAESNILIKAVQEILNPIENPRYILERRSTFFKLFTSKDYHAVPTIIGTNKIHVDYFHTMWKKYIGYNDIYYTRSLEGRPFLLKTKKQAFSDLMRDKTVSLNKWL